MHHFDHPQAAQVMFALCGMSSVLGFFIARSFGNMPKTVTGDEDILKNEKTDNPV